METSTLAVLDPKLIEAAKAVLFTAYQASVLVGLGLLNYRGDLTSDQIWEGVPKRTMKHGGLEIYTDYVAGRMMKTLITILPDNSIYVHPETPNTEHQSWARAYPSAILLIADALKDLDYEVSYRTRCTCPVCGALFDDVEHNNPEPDGMLGPLLVQPERRKHSHESPQCVGEEGWSEGWRTKTRMIIRW